MTTQEILEAARSAKSALALADNTARNAALLGMADALCSADDQAAILQLEAVRADGSVVIVATDEDWTAGGGPIEFSGLYEGETHDARLADDDPTAWTKPGHDGR